MKFSKENYKSVAFNVFRWYSQIPGGHISGSKIAVLRLCIFKTQNITTL